MAESETMDSLQDLFVYPKSKGKRTFVIVNLDGSETGQYTGKTPRQAALKAIKEVYERTNEPVTLKIRERGTKKIHVFRGHVSLEKVPEIHPAWMKADSIMTVAHVAKVGIENVDKIGAELVKSGTITSETVAKVNALPLPKVN